jgi:hypothetical protein
MTNRAARRTAQRGRRKRETQYVAHFITPDNLDDEPDIYPTFRNYWRVEVRDKAAPNNKPKCLTCDHRFVDDEAWMLICLWEKRGAFVQGQCTRCASLGLLTDDELLMRMMSTTLKGLGAGQSLGVSIRRRSLGAGPPKNSLH